MKRVKLTKLECLRGFASIYVVIGHICNIHFHNQGPICQLFRYAAEAVILFFLLSGLVIRYSTKDEISFKEYFFKRFRRIYPLFFLSLWLGYFLISFAERQWQQIKVYDLLGNVALLQDFNFRRPGVWFPQFYNDALWSLSYEWMFYMLFYPLMKWSAPWKTKNLAVWALAIASFLVHQVWPNQLGWFGMYFAIWWSGVSMATELRETGTVTLKRQLGPVSFLGLFSLLWAGMVLKTPRDQWSLGLYPIVDLRRFASAAVFITFGCLWKQIGWPLFNVVFGVFEKLAPISYGMYVLHFPVVTAYNSIPYLSSQPILFVVCTVGTVILIAYLGEGLLQSWINKLTDPWLKSIIQKSRPVTTD